MNISTASKYQLCDQFYIIDQDRRTTFYSKTDVADLAPLCASLRHTYEHDLTRYFPIVQQLCQTRFAPHPVTVRPLGETGTFHVLYRADVTHNQSVIVRLNRRDVHTAFEFLIEERIYSLLGQRSIAAPQLIATDLSRRICPTDYQIVTYVEGKNLKAFEDPETQHMPSQLVRSIGAYLATIHEIVLVGYGPLSVKELMIDASRLCGLHASWRDYLMLRLDEHLLVCQKIAAIDDYEVATIKELFSKNDVLFDDVAPRLLHGDVGNHNFISADGLTIAALIDWEDAMAGDPVFDIAYWGTFFKDHMLEDFLAGYTTIRTLPPDFQLRYWLYYLRIALSKTVHRFHFGYKDHPGRQPAATRIQRALKKL